MGPGSDAHRLVAFHGTICLVRKIEYIRVELRFFTFPLSSHYLFVKVEAFLFLMLYQEKGKKRDFMSVSKAG